MPAGRFHLEEVVEGFLGQPLLAGLPAAALQRTSRLRTWAGQWVGIDISLKAVELVNMRLHQSHGRPVLQPAVYRPRRHPQTLIRQCITTRTSTCCSARSKAYATGAGPSSHSTSWKWTTSFSTVARATSRTCSCCAPTATASRATGRRSTLLPCYGSWG